MPDFPPYDFHNPFMSARIISPTGEVVPLWTNRAEMQLDAKFENLPSMAILTELVVELNLGMYPRMTVTLSPTYADALKILDINQDLIGWGESLFEAQFGYIGPEGPALSPIFSGLILKPDVSIGQEVTISFTAQGGPGWSAARQGGGTQMKATRDKLIARLASGYDLKNPRLIEVNTDAIKQAGSGSPAFIKMFTEERNLSAGWKSDWFVIAQLVMECRCWMYLMGPQTPGGKSSTLKIFPIDSARGQVPKYSFQLYPQGRIGSRSQSLSKGAEQAPVFPILNFTSPTSAVYLSAMSGKKGAFMKGIDDASGTTFSKWLGDAEVAPTRIGPQGDAGPKGSANHPQPDEESGDGGAGIQKDQASPDVVTKLEAEYVANLTKMGVRIEIETLGVPDILPGDAIHVSGIGTRLEGNYSVFELVHTLGGSGYSTNLVAYSNTSAVLAQVEEAQGEWNKKPPEPGAGTTALPKENAE